MLTLEKSQINNLSSHLYWGIERKEQDKHKSKKGNSTDKAEIENRKTIEKINKTKKLVLWKNQQNWQCSSKADKERESEESNYQYQKINGKFNYRHCRSQRIRESREQLIYIWHLRWKGPAGNMIVSDERPDAFPLSLGTRQEYQLLWFFLILMLGMQ